MLAATKRPAKIQTIVLTLAERGIDGGSCDMLKLAARRFRGRPMGRDVDAETAPHADYCEIPPAVRWSFIGFVAALPFEAANLAFTSSAFSLAKLSGLIFLGCYLFFYNPLSGRRPFPENSAPLSWFLIYLLVFAVNGLFLNDYYLSQFVSIFLTLAQLLLFFWISSSLFRVEILTRRALLGFAAGAVLCAVGTLLNVPGFASAIATRAGERITAMEFNPNYLAYTTALAAVILISAALDIKTRPWAKVLSIATVLPLLALLVRTGSRSGVLAFAIGFCACLLPNRGQSGRRFSVILLVVAISAASIYLAVRHPMVLARFQESYAGNLAGRQMIIPASLEMISERPVFGWQPVAFWEELGSRVGKIWGARDAHNLIFHLMLEVGLFGAVPFFIGLWLCLAGAWRARGGKFGNLPFALLAMTLSANLSHTYLTRKPQWIVLALAVAAATAAQRSLAAPYLIRRPLRSTGRVSEGQLNAGQRQF